MPELLNFRFPKGWYFLKSDNTELKRSSKIFFFLFPNGIAGRFWVKSHEGLNQGGTQGVENAIFQIYRVVSLDLLRIAAR